jgi:hypothetical protein
MATRTITESVLTGKQHVAHSAVAAQTLFGEMAAIRQIQERLMMSSSEKDSLLGPSKIKMS